MSSSKSKTLYTRFVGVVNGDIKKGATVYAYEGKDKRGTVELGVIVVLGAPVPLPVRGETGLESYKNKDFQTLLKQGVTIDPETKKSTGGPSIYLGQLRPVGEGGEHKAWRPFVWEHGNPVVRFVPPGLSASVYGRSMPSAADLAARRNRDAEGLPYFPNEQDVFKFLGLDPDRHTTADFEYACPLDTRLTICC